MSCYVEANSNTGPSATPYWAVRVRNISNKVCDFLFVFAHRKYGAGTVYDGLSNVN